MAGKLTYTELATVLRGCPPAGRIYRHYKTGNLYVVAGSAVSESDQEALVLYRPFGNTEDGAGLVTFCRPLREWEQLVEWKGRYVPRFDDSVKRA